MAKQDTEVLVKVGGWFLGFAEKLMAELVRLGVSSDDIYGFVKKGGDVPVRKIAEELAKLMVVAKEGISELLVNYDLTVEALVRECGCDWNNKNITSKNFPTKRTGQRKVETKTFHFNKTMTPEEIIAEMKKEGFRPVELHELLAYGIKNPEEQRKHTIIALGSVWRVWDGDRSVAYLYGGGGGRGLDLGCFDDGWRGDCRFLAVRES